MASTDVAYCTLEDVREVLQKAEISFGDAELADEFVEAAIFGESEWIQEDTNRHWYDADAEIDDPDDILADGPLTHEHDEKDVPSSPHSDHVQMFGRGRGRQARYPTRFAGPYTRVALTRRDVSEITELLVRQQDGSVDDWLANGRRSEGRGEDYYVQIDDALGMSRLYLNSKSLPRLSDFGAAVVATYDYGIPQIPKTVRTATACFAGAHLLRDDESAVAIPDSGQLMSLETKADKLYDRGMRLLEIHR